MMPSGATRGNRADTPLDAERVGSEERLCSRYHHLQSVLSARDVTSGLHIHGIQEDSRDVLTRPPISQAQ
jgi:hypothetical protein